MYAGLTVAKLAEIKYHCEDSSLIYNYGMVHTGTYVCT